MGGSHDSKKAVCDRRDILKLAGGALLGNTAVRLGVVASVAATTVMVDALPALAQPGKELETKRSSQRLNGKTMFEWMNDLKDRDVSVRERAIAALKVYGQDAREAAPTIIKAIAEKDMSLRVNAIITLGFIGMEPKDRQAGVNALKNRLTTAESQGIVRFQAAQALGRLGKEGYDATPQLMSVSHDRYCWEIRAAAVTALSYTGWDPTGKGFDVPAFNAVLEATKDECVEVRVQALLSLIRFGTPGIPTLKRTLDNALHSLKADKRQNKRVVIWAHVALMRIQDPDDPKTQKVIDNELKPIGEFLRDRDLETRTNAARAIAYVGDKAKLVVPQLTDALEDNEGEMLAWTCTALEKIGAAAAPAAPALRRLLNHPDPAVRSAAKAALDKIGDKAAR